MGKVFIPAVGFGYQPGLPAAFGGEPLCSHIPYPDFQRCHDPHSHHPASRPISAPEKAARAKPITIAPRSSSPSIMSNPLCANIATKRPPETLWRPGVRNRQSIGKRRDGLFDRGHWTCTATPRSEDRVVTSLMPLCYRRMASITADASRYRLRGFDAPYLRN